MNGKAQKIAALEATLQHAEDAYQAAYDAHNYDACHHILVEILEPTELALLAEGIRVR